MVIWVNSPIPVHLSSLIPRMSMFTLAIFSLTTSNLLWFMDLTFQVTRGALNTAVCLFVCFFLCQGRQVCLVGWLKSFSNIPSSLQVAVSVVGFSWIPLSIFPAHFCVVLLCSSCSINTQVFFKWNCSICWCRFYVPLGGGELRVFLPCHPGYLSNTLCWRDKITLMTKTNIYGKKPSLYYKVSILH